MVKGMNSFSQQVMHLLLLFATLWCTINIFTFIFILINGIRTNMSVWVSLSYVLHIPPYNFYIIKGDFFLNRHALAMIQRSQSILLRLQNPYTLYLNPTRTAQCGFAKKGSKSHLFGTSQKLSNKRFCIFKLLNISNVLSETPSNCMIANLTYYQYQVSSSIFHHRTTSFPIRDHYLICYACKH